MPTAKTSCPLTGLEVGEGLGLVRLATSCVVLQNPLELGVTPAQASPFRGICLLPSFLSYDVTFLVICPIISPAVPLMGQTEPLALRPAGVPSGLACLWGGSLAPLGPWVASAACSPSGSWSG